MKHFLLPAIVLFSAITLGFALPEDELTPDEKAVHAAIEDYVLGFYRAEPARLERSLSSDLKKMGFWRAESGDEFRGPVHMNHEQACELARTWNAEGQQGEDLAYTIELHEVAD